MDETQARIKQPKAGVGLRLFGADDVRRHGPDNGGFRLDGQGQEIDQPPHGGFGGTQHANDSAMQAAGNPLRGAIARQSQQREEPGDNAREGFSVVIDGCGEGQWGLFLKWNKKRT